MTSTPTVEQISPDFCTITMGGDRYLGIRLSDTESSRSAKQFVEDGMTPGYVIADSLIHTWKPIGLKEIEGRVYLYGPYFPGRTIESIVTHDPSTAFSYLARLSAALTLLAARGHELPSIQTNGLFFLEDGGVLILPPIILERLRNVQTIADRQRTYEVFNHPILTGERAVVFSLGVLGYRIATGNYPFAGVDEVDLRHRMREVTPIPARLRNPSVSAEASATFEAALDSKSETSLSLEELNSRIARFAKEGIFAQVDEHTRSSLLAAATALERRRERGYSRRVFLRNHGRTLAWSGVGLVIVISLASSIIANVLRPRVTLGKSPVEVVEIFYSSITTLDHQAIEDCVTGDVGKGEVNEATNLYVITRMRLGNEGTTGFIDPVAWLENSAPPLGETLSVYGIEGLEITARSETTFVAEYRKWEQLVTETMAYRISGSNSTVRERRDIVELEYREPYWVIVAIDREVDRLIDPDEIELPR